MTNIIFLDVDGPLNPYNMKFEDEKKNGFNHFKVPYQFSLSLDVIVHPDHGTKLLQLAEDTHSSIVWATTWENDANVYIGPRIGLPTLPFVDYTGSTKKTYGFWKMPATLEYAGNNRFVWFDDDLLKSDRNYIKANSNGLGIYVDPAQGLMDEHFDRARGFLKTNRSSQSGKKI